jgi:hypothetical protein
MALMSILASAWWELREQWTYAGILNAQLAGGSANPVLDARRELFFRAEYLERYRDYASERYMKGHDLKSSADCFIKRRLMTGTTILSAGDAAMLRSVIRGMGEREALHAQALAKYRGDMNKALANINEQATQLYGPGGRPPRVERVLRGRGE